MIESLTLSNVGPAPELKMEFGSRVNLITGDNGLGKSFLLDVVWWALTRKWPQELNANLTAGYPARPTNRKKTATIEFAISGKSKTVSYRGTYSVADEAWLGKPGRPHNPGLVIYAHSDGGFSVWDPARNYWKKQGNIDVQNRVPGYVFSPKEVWEGLYAEAKGRVAPLCNGLLIDLPTWIREEKEIAELFSTVVETLSPSEDEADRLSLGPLTRVSVDYARDVPTIKTAYSDAVPILHCSAGVRRVVALAYMLVWSWNEHVLASDLRGEKETPQIVLLVDELEGHLHPRWQRTILPALLGTAENLHPQASIQFILATHSPLVLASAEPIFDPSTDAWFDLDLIERRKKHVVELTRREFTRRGDASNWLESDAFDLERATSVAYEDAVKKALALYRDPNPSRESMVEVETLLKDALGDTDRFWVGWTAFKKSKGFAS